MKYILRISVLVILTGVSFMFFSACKLGLRPTMPDNDEEGIATKRAENIITAIQGKDKPALRDMFSVNAREESEHLEEGIAYLFSFFEGNEVECVWRSQTTETIRRSGRRTIKMSTWFNINTEKQEYVLYMLDFTVDEINPNNEGLYSLCIVNVVDIDTQLYPLGNLEIAGIYMPEDVSE